MGLYLNEHWRLKAYSSTTKGGKSLVRIEVETEDFQELGFFLSTLSDIERTQKRNARKRSPALLALPAPDGGA